MEIPNPHSSRLQYSLLSLCAVALVVCFVAAYIGSTRRHAAAERQVVELQAQNRAQAREILVLKNRVGDIAVRDPLKVHIRQLPTSGAWEREWKFRIYVPPGKDWRLWCRCGNIPASGFDVPYPLHTGWSLLPPGQTDLEVFVRPTEDGQGAIFVRTRNSPLRISITRNQLLQLTRGDATSTDWGDMTREMFGEEPYPLLRFRTKSEQAPGEEARTVHPTEEPGFGLLLWLDTYGGQP